MADHAQSAVELGGIVDVADHERTYRGFLTLTKWGTIVVAVIVAFLFAVAF
ncbi:MAG: aa3-type cytochrome c oxidase subunit IV [Bauldia sp.]